MRSLRRICSDRRPQRTLDGWKRTLDGSKNIVVEAYSLIAHGEILNNAELVAMAGHYGVSVPQLCIRYTLQLGCVSLPKTANPQHMRSNAEVDFVISDADMQTLRNLDERDYGDSSAFPVYSGK